MREALDIPLPPPPPPPKLGEPTNEVLQQGWEGSFQPNPRCPPPSLPTHAPLADDRWSAWEGRPSSPSPWLSSQELMKTPIKSMMAKARGEDLKKTAVAEGMADTVSSPRAGGFDETKQVAGGIAALPLARG